MKSLDGPLTSRRWINYWWITLYEKFNKNTAQCLSYHHRNALCPPTKWTRNKGPRVHDQCTCTGKDRGILPEDIRGELGQEDPLPLIGLGPMMSSCELSATKLPRYLLASSFKARAVQSDVATRIFFSLCLVDGPEGSPITQTMRSTDEFSSGRKSQRETK